MNSINIYMMGAITHHEKNNELYKAITWRNELAQELLNLNADLCANKFDWFDPTYRYEQNLNYSNQTIIKQNEYYLNKCDIGIVNLDCLEFSPGTLFEIFYYYLQHKPVLAFGYSNIINQPHVKSSITELFPNIEYIIKYLRNMYCQ